MTVKVGLKTIIIDTFYLIIIPCIVLTKTHLLVLYCAPQPPLYPPTIYQSVGI